MRSLIAVVALIGATAALTSGCGGGNQQQNRDMPSMGAQSPAPPAGAPA